MCVGGVALHICFFFNDTATTEIYTYGHTLSRHDALPISHPKPNRPLLRFATGDLVELRDDPCPCGRTGRRSEEHTSELQSLMRISSAVFCLKKKTRQRKATHQDC